MLPSLGGVTAQPCWVEHNVNTLPLLQRQQSVFLSLKFRALEPHLHLQLHAQAPTIVPAPTTFLPFLLLQHNST
jgi:hypothetical protein